MPARRRQSHREPVWTREEITLAFDLYVSAGRKALDARHPQVLELSRVLRALPFHAPNRRGERFRSPDSVARKLGNIQTRDPQFKGVGQPHGNKLEPLIWQEFIDSPDALHRTAALLRALADHDGEDDIGLDEVFPEGGLVMRAHRRKERSSKAVAAKKTQVLGATGRLACEACGFDFHRFYGDIGEAFAECHHTVPLNQTLEVVETRLNDLAIVCANCHRMIHRARPELSIQELSLRIAGGSVNRSW